METMTNDKTNKRKSTASREIGYTSFRHGFLEIKIARRPTRRVLLHHHVWERAHGKIPENHVVIFKDGDRRNCDLSNLELISRAWLGRRFPPVNQPSRWTDEKIRLLRELFNSATNAAIGEKLGFHKETVRRKAAALGLVKDAAFRSRGGRRIRTDEKIRLLEELYPLHTAAEVAKKLGVSRPTVYNRARRLGLVRRDAVRQGWRSAESRLSAIAAMRLAHSEMRRRKEAELRGRYDIGTEKSFVARDGRLRIAPGEEDAGLLLHRYLWERAHGKIPENHIVIFKDGNSFNCNLSNLELISAAERNRRIRLAGYPAEVRPVVEMLLELRRAIRERAAAGGGRYRTRTFAVWTDDDLSFLRNNYGRMPNAAIAARLQRPLAAVTSAAFKLKLTRRRKARHSPLFSTPEEIAAFREIYPVSPNKAVAAAFDCSRGSVSAAARRFDIGKGKGTRTIKRRAENA